MDWGKIFQAFEVAIGFIPPEDAQAKAAANAVMKAVPAIGAAVATNMSDHTPEAKVAAAQTALQVTTAALGSTLTGGAADTFQQVAPVAVNFLSLIMDAFKTPATPAS